MTPPLLVLHAFGAVDAGAPWRAALADGWDSAWSAPDLPGHGSAPWEGDCYELTDLVVAPLRHLQSLGWPEPPVVVAVGEQATAARLLALGGRAAGIALAGAPEPSEPSEASSAVADRQRREYAWLRSLADDVAAQSPPPRGRTDPRTALGLTPERDAAHAERQRAAMTVPALEIADVEPRAVLTAVRRWWR